MKKQGFVIALSVLAGAASAQQEPIQFNAKGIVAISDADLTASALVDGRLYREVGVRDALYIIRFPLDRSGSNIATTPVSNSMTLYDKALVVSNNGRFAFVLEGHGQTGDSLNILNNGVEGLPASSKMFTVDLNATPKPQVKYGFSVGNLPTAVALSPQGNTMVVASGETGKELRVIEVDAGGKPTRILTAASPVPNARITDLVWHPGGQFIAYSIAGSQEIGLMKYSLDATKKPNLIPHGKTIKVGTMPTCGKFTPDGNFFILADAKRAIGAQGVGAGELFVLQFSTVDTPGEHKIVSQAATGELPEAVSVSPDGSLIIVANAGQSYQPFGRAGAGRSSLSVYTFDKAGKLTLANQYDFEGIMPQAVEFDKSGEAIAVAVSEYLDYGNRIGGIEFWRVAKGDKPTLTKQPGRISVTRGVHAFKVIN